MTFLLVFSIGFNLLATADSYYAKHDFDGKFLLGSNQPARSGKAFPESREAAPRRARDTLQLGPRDGSVGKSERSCGGIRGSSSAEPELRRGAQQSRLIAEGQLGRAQEARTHYEQALRINRISSRHITILGNSSVALRPNLGRDFPLRSGGATQTRFLRGPNEPWGSAGAIRSNPESHWPFRVGCLVPEFCGSSLQFGASPAGGREHPGGDVAIRGRSANEIGNSGRVQRTGMDPRYQRTTVRRPGCPRRGAGFQGMSALEVPVSDGSGRPGCGLRRPPGQLSAVVTAEKALVLARAQGQAQLAAQIKLECNRVSRRHRYRVVEQDPQAH